MAVDRYGGRLQAGTTPAQPPRREKTQKGWGPRCVWTEYIESGGVISQVVRVYQHMHAVSATLAKTSWSREEQVVLIPMYDSSAEEESILRRVAMASALKELYKRMQNQVTKAGASDPSFEGDYPALYDFLTLALMEGKARELGTLTVFCQDGRFKGSLQDKETKHYCFVSSDTFLGLLEAMEGALVNAEHEWRESKPFVVNKGKK